MYSYDDSNHIHAVTSYNGTSYGYDANGSMTTRGSQTIRYDKQCRPVRVDSGGSTVCRFAYDGDGVRRKRLDASGTIHYLGVYERNLGNGQDTTEVITKYYPASLGTMSRLIAFRKAGTLYYVGTDHLGSTIRVADASFNAVDGQRYKPFGGDRDAGTNLKTDHKYTNQIEDASIGLYWYGFRAYDPAIGRFVAPDTIVPNPGNPQNLNRYSYALNNPLRYSDPTGHDIFEEDPEDDGLSADATSIGESAGDEVPADVFVEYAGYGPAETSVPEHVIPDPNAIAASGQAVSKASPAIFSSTQNGFNDLVGGVIAGLSGGTTRTDSHGNTLVENVGGPVGWVLQDVLNGGRQSAVTIGHLILNNTSFGESTQSGALWLAHESAHVKQGEELGALYLPLYVALWIGSGFSHESHPMEKQANAYADANWHRYLR